MGNAPLIRIATLLIALVGVLSPAAFAARYDGKLTVRALDEETGQLIPVRMELRNSRGRPVRVRAAGVVSLDDYFVFDGQVTLELRKGDYRFLMEAGPEYQTREGHFTIDRRAEDSTDVVLRRRVNMQQEGWWAADLDVRHRDVDLPLLMRAAAVDYIPQVVRENVQGKCKKRAVDVNNLGDCHGLLDFRRGGGLLLFSRSGIPGFCDRKKNESSVPTLEAAVETEATVVALAPFAWDLPLWVASGRLDAVQIIHRHALVDDVVDNEGWGRKRDKTFFPGKTGNGRWSETIYHHLLNCGLQIPPAAGSGSGTNKNPLGTNRVYVHCGDDFTPENWFRGLREGKVSVTNGPLLRTEVSGHAPGHQFQLDRGAARDFQIALGLAFYEKAPVAYLEIVKNGRVEHEIRLSELAEKQGRLPPLRFDDSGWFLVRAMTSTTKNYQFATTGPYYVQSDYQPRISRASVQFFLDWLDAAEAEFAENEAVLADIASARPFWSDLLGRANAE